MAEDVLKKPADAPEVAIPGHEGYVKNSAYIDKFKEERILREELTKSQFDVEQQIKQFDQAITDRAGGVAPYLEDEQVFILDYFLYNYKNFNVESEFTPGVEAVPVKENFQTFLNRLSIPDEFEKLVHIRPADYARLTPSYEIFKVLYEGGNIVGEEPFIFSNFSDLSNLYDQSATFRGHGAGIKSANISLNGKNTVTSRQVDVKLTLMFQDINTVWAIANNDASYVDLFSYPDINKEQYYRIKMLLGYNGYPDTSLGDTSLRYSKLMMMLDYKIHTIEINENGTCKVVIDYTGALEYVFSDPEVSNIVFENNVERQVTREIKLNIEKISEESKKLTEADLKKVNVRKHREKSDSFEKLVDATKTDEVLKKELEDEIRDKHLKAKNLKEEFQNERKNEFLKSRMNRLLTIFHKKLTIFQVSLKAGHILDYREWLESGTVETKTSSVFSLPMYKITNTGGVVGEGADGAPTGGVLDAVESAVSTYEIWKGSLFEEVGITPVKTKAELTVSNLNQQFNEDSFKNRLVSFVLLKDLLSAVLDELNPKIARKYGRNFKILFGNIVFQPANSDNAVSMNIGDIPISLTKLNYFFADKLIGRGLVVYTFQQFFQDLFDDFFVRANENAMKMRSVDSSKKRMKNNFELNYLQIYEKDGKYTVLQNEAGGPVNEVLFIYGNSVSSAETFNFQDNIANGISHMFFGGVDRGIVKKIKFADNTNAKVKAAIWEQNRGDNSVDDLSKYGGTLTPLVYNAEVTLIGYPYIINGNTIFIDTAALGLNEGKAVNLLLGGYYLVTKVVHDLTIDKFETKISAILVADYRLKGKIAEQVNIVGAAEFYNKFPTEVYDADLIRDKEEKAAQFLLDNQIVVRVLE